MEKIVAHLNNGTEFTFVDRNSTGKVTLEKVAKELKRNGCVLFGDRDNEVLLFEREIMWIKREIR